jgi:hypothetical protein
MKRLLLLVLLPAYSFVSAQQSRLPLNFNSYAIRLCVAKDESLSLTSKMGDVGITNSIRSEWRRADVNAGESYGKTLEQPNFFNKDTGFVSGFISNNGKYNIIYHTVNGGKNWKTVNFGQDGWVDHAVNLNNGEAWLSVAGSGIAYTNDYGLSWKKFTNPEVRQRFHTIYFNTARHGIIGSLWNLLAYTEDNCKNWKFLPTPLDQGKYKKTNKESRPELDRVAIFGKYFLVQQEELVFYSNTDSINWTWLPEYEDFYTDAENSALFFKTVKSNYVQSDSSLKPLREFEMAVGAYDAKVKNGSLYIVDTEKMIRLNAHDIPEIVDFASKAEDTGPVEIGYTREGILGVADNKLFTRKDYSGPWKYLLTFPYPLEKASLTVAEGGLLKYDRKDDSLFYFDLSGKLVKQFSKSAMVAKFSKSKISQIVFNQGSRGCFHYHSDNLIYKNLGTFFGNAVAEEDNKRPGMPDNEPEIDAADVNKLVRALPQLFDRKSKTTISDLNFSEKDFERCKKDILDFQASLSQTKKQKKETVFSFNRNNLDFNRLISLVDSVKDLDPLRLEAGLSNLNEMWSTTTNWKTVTFINDDNEELTISSSYYKPNAFYFPWIISLNGHSVFTNNIEIVNFIEKTYPAFLGDRNKVEMLHSLVKQLY